MDRTERDVVKIIALLDQVEHRLNALGHMQAMSVGPPLEDVDALREKVIGHAKAYGVMTKHRTTESIRHDATGYDVTIEESQETPEVNYEWGGKCPHHTPRTPICEDCKMKHLAMDAREKIKCGFGRFRVGVDPEVTRDGE